MEALEAIRALPREAVAMASCRSAAEAVSRRSHRLCAQNTTGHTGKATKAATADRSYRQTFEERDGAVHRRNDYSLG